MVFYRKYRPQKIEELDSETVRASLLAILTSGSIPHAFLFSGPKGLGKTSAARIVAKIVNCEGKGERPKGKGTIEPCNKCSQCISIMEGTNLDVLEIDAASNRGIDEIRDLRDKIRLAPVAAKNKIYVIDEVHMLTKEAFNALLKTLEEPPPHTIFILCTTELEKLPGTIASRCFIINFKKATNEEIIRSLSRIIKKEKIKIEREAVSEIAEISEGSFRDAAKILEQTKAVAGRKKITKELIEKEYRAGVKIESLLEAILSKDTKRALLTLEEMVKKGVSIKFLNEEFLHLFHGMVLQKLGVEGGRAVNNNRETPPIEELKKLIELLGKAAVEAKTAVIPQLPLELAIIEWGMEDSAGRSDFLRRIIEKVKLYNHSVAGVLRGCKISSFDGEKIIIETGYKFHKERLEEEKIRELLERVGSELSGKNIAISVVLKRG